MYLSSFLKLGYFIDKENPDLEEKFQFDIDKEKYRNLELPELIEIGTSKFFESFEKVFPPNKLHLIPLSGGLDSRAILAFLLEFTEAKNIRTYTFGTPHTYDYDIGNYIAKKAGTSHISIPLNKHRYTHDGMLEAAVKNEHSTVLFHHPPVKLIDEYFNGCCTWSGFMAGSLAGSGLDKPASKTMNEASRQFFKKNTYVSSTSLTNDESQDFLKYLDVPEFRNHQLTLDEQLNFFNRQKKLTYNHVKLCGKNMIFPFLEKGWANFILSIDNNFRMDKFFYESMLYKDFPKLFKYKTKNKGGLPLYPGVAKTLIRKLKFRTRQYVRMYYSGSKFGISPWENYLNFNSHIRNNKNFNRIIYESINDLKDRGIVDNINIQELYDNHMKGYKDHADALLVLASLEYHLKSGLDPNQLIT